MFLFEVLLLPVHRCPLPPKKKSRRENRGRGEAVCTLAGLGEMWLKNLNTIGSYVGLIHIRISSSSIPSVRKLSRKGETK